MNKLNHHDQDRRIDPISENETDRLQRRMLELLKNTPIDATFYAGLDQCGPDRCGRVGCSEACAYGGERRWKRAVPNIINLLTQQDEPVYEVRVHRPFWIHKFGELIGCNDIRSARGLVRRVLDSLFDNTVLAVGTYKTFPYARWIGEIHLIVAAHDEEALTKSFSKAGPGQYTDVRVSPIHDLRTKIAEVLDCNIPTAHLRCDEISREQHAELYRWLLRLDVDARVMKYGCNSMFRLKQRKPRTMKPKIRKPRPFPSWLMPYWFGSGEFWNDKPDPNQAGFEPRPKGRGNQHSRGEKYYDDDDEHK